MKFAIVTLAGAILMGFAVLADSIRIHRSHGEPLIIIGGIVMALGLIGTMMKDKAE